MIEHSPLPWYVEGYKHPSHGSPHGVKVQSSRGDGFEFRVALCPKHPGIDRTTAEANAALIVRSVNLLPEALAALEAAEQRFEAIRLLLINDLQEPQRSAFWAAVNAKAAARAVLQKARQP
ncbi:MAG: hypothetical protein EPN91_05775 [Salinibacterium sp.]|nr:MAG: hypothetical protein EPN91_05775 [Salinibacterium sp.]